MSDVRTPLSPRGKGGEGGGGPGAHFVLGLRTSVLSPRPRNLREACSHAPFRGPHPGHALGRGAGPRPASFPPPGPARRSSGSRIPPQPRRGSAGPKPYVPPRLHPSSLPAGPQPPQQPPAQAPLRLSARRAGAPSPLSRPRVRPRPSAQHPQPQPARPVWTVPPGKQMHQRVPLGHSLSRMSSGR